MRTCWRDAIAVCGRGCSPPSSAPPRSAARNGRPWNAPWLDDQYANLAGNLAYGNQRLLEIARALASEPRFLILDEPAGGMNDQETADLMLLIKAIQKRGITILLIEHDMSLVMRVCEKIVVLENGALIAEGTSAEIKRNPRVIEAYLGAEG